MDDIIKVIVTNEEDFDECPFHRDSFINLFMLAKLVEADRKEEK